MYGSRICDNNNNGSGFSLVHLKLFSVEKYCTSIVTTAAAMYMEDCSKKKKKKKGNRPELKSSFTLQQSSGLNIFGLVIKGN